MSPILRRATTLSSPDQIPEPAAPSAADWLARRLNGSFGAADQRAFLDWLNASPENRQAYAEAERLWEQMRALDTLAAPQLAEARAFMAQRRRSRRRWPVPAAAAALLVLALSSWSLFFSPDGYRTAVGEQRSVELADGSRLDLNTDSEVIVRYSPTGRGVELKQGQAIFTVAHGDARPFDVHAGGGIVRDIGTRFDVRLRQRTTTVAVLDGAVEVIGDGRRLALQRGQGVSYGRDGLPGVISEVDVERQSAWREGKLHFRAQPLAEVIEEVQRYHRATIVIADPSLREIRVSGVFPTDDLSRTLQTIAATLPVSLQRNGDRWSIARR